MNRQQLQRGAEHIHTLGPRALAELLAAIADRSGQPALVETMVREYRGLTPAMLRATGGDRFPPLMTIVPAAGDRGGA